MEKLTTNNNRSHTIKLGTSLVDVKHENKRLFKFISWEDTKDIAYNYIANKLVSISGDFNSIDEFILELESVNPMRRSRFGSFYLDIKGKVLDKEKEFIGDLSEFNIKHVHVDGYECHDSDEINKRKKIEENFGQDQYAKQYSILSQVLEDIIDKVDTNKNCLSITKDNLPEMSKLIMDSTGWSETEDNRLHSRIKRLPPTIVIPE